jgi:pyruvate formate lyase activating enzyme
MREDGRIECRLCPRGCKLKPGQRGFCFSRQRIGDEMVLTTYGRSTGFCIDPIEKKPLNQFLPGTSVLSFGTAGCNLGCRFCQNWQISKARETDQLADSALPEAVAAAAVRYGCRSVAFTYNDPVISAEYTIDVAQACRERGIRSVAVTAGYITEDARGGILRRHGRRERGPEGVQRALLREILLRPAPAGAGHLGLPAPGDGSLARGDHAPDSGGERQQ